MIALCQGVMHTLGVRRTDSRHTIALGTRWAWGPVRVVRMRHPAPSVDPYGLDFEPEDDASYPIVARLSLTFASVSLCWENPELNKERCAR